MTAWLCAPPPAPRAPGAGRGAEPGGGGCQRCRPESRAAEAPPAPPRGSVSPDTSPSAAPSAPAPLHIQTSARGRGAGAVTASRSTALRANRRPASGTRPARTNPRPPASRGAPANHRSPPTMHPGLGAAHVQTASGSQLSCVRCPGLASRHEAGAAAAAGSGVRRLRDIPAGDRAEPLGFGPCLRGRSETRAAAPCVSPVSASPCLLCRSLGSHRSQRHFCPPLAIESSSPAAPRASAPQPGKQHPGGPGNPTEGVF